MSTHTHSLKNSSVIFSSKSCSTICRAFLSNSIFFLTVSSSSAFLKLKENYLKFKNYPTYKFYHSQFSVLKYNTNNLLFCYSNLYFFDAVTFDPILFKKETSYLLQCTHRKSAIVTRLFDFQSSEYKEELKKFLQKRKYGEIFLPVKIYTLLLLSIPKKGGFSSEFLEIRRD